jgi:hypothetical protein
MSEGRVLDAVFAMGIMGNPAEIFLIDEALTLCATVTPGTSPTGSTVAVGICVAGADVSVSDALGSGLGSSAEGGAAAIGT